MKTYKEFVIENCPTARFVEDEGDVPGLWIVAEEGYLGEGVQTEEEAWADAARYVRTLLEPTA